MQQPSPRLTPHIDRSLPNRFGRLRAFWRRLATWLRPPTGLQGAQPALLGFMQRARSLGQDCACLFLALDQADDLRRDLAPAQLQHLREDIITRLRPILRSEDRLGPDGATGIWVALAPTAQMNLESLLAIAGRLMAAADQPFDGAGRMLYPSCSIGLALASQCPGDGPAQLEYAARQALQAAQAHAPAAIRLYSASLPPAMPLPQPSRSVMTQALQKGQMQPWFQPQISTDTGDISGLEMLARWHHPNNGILSPANFLPALGDAHLLPNLCELMVQTGLAWLSQWDHEGLGIPEISVNLSAQDLADPGLADRIAWHLDRVNIAPHRLRLEILETIAAAPPNDASTRALGQLAALGCPIDLDDFGTANASISAIRRFHATRIKIDRSFISHIETDRSQQQLVAAMISMAEHLQISTLAEGVETAGAHAMLCQLGCQHVQGFGIAHPMPGGDLGKWLASHRAKQGSIENWGPKLRQAR